EGPTRIRIPLGIAYKESVEQAREVIMPLLSAHPMVIKNDQMKPRVQLRELADSSLNLSAQVWVRAEDVEVKGRISCELLEAIKQGLDDAGIEMPFPHLQLFIDEAKGLAPWLDRQGKTESQSEKGAD
ncbi:MAG: mechanosensitive ion channel, partial [Oceanisphaera sp.]|nr:mechanosensitive ion channel [Oceanisphaera sp.]